MAVRPAYVVYEWDLLGLLILGLLINSRMITIKKIIILNLW